MAMEFEGVVHKVLEPVKGQSARGEWTKQEVVFELPGEYSRKACVSFWGDKAQDAAGLQPGDPVTVSFNIESREYNGRWFTELRAWRIARPVRGADPGGAAPYGSPAAGAGYPPMPDRDLPPVGSSSPADDPDDLPF